MVWSTTLLNMYLLSSLCSHVTPRTQFLYFLQKKLIWGLSNFFLLWFFKRLLCWKKLTHLTSSFTKQMGFSLFPSVIRRLQGRKKLLETFYLRRKIYWYYIVRWRVKREIERTLKINSLLNSISGDWPKMCLTKHIEEWRRREAYHWIFSAFFSIKWEVKPKSTCL